MNAQVQFSPHWPSTSWLSSASIVALSILVGAAIVLTINSPHTFALPALGIIAVALFVVYPELALAAYVVIGDVKGNESIASLLPVDLTLVMGVILLAGIGLNLLRGRHALRPPKIYFSFVALVLVMAASLAYTPAFGAGLDKFGRFLTVTAIVIIAPFFVLNTPSAMKRFLIAFSAAAFSICAWSLSDLGGNHRLVSPSDNTIGLGHIACALFVLLWVGVALRCSFPRRAIAYPLLVVPALALIGSASRGSVIACLLVLAISILANRRLLVDAVCLSVVGIAGLPLIGIPGASISYLASLIRSHNVSDLLNFRGDLLAYGWRLLRHHPILGAGLAGFRYLSPNPTLYKWPHNIFLETACELGVPAALLVAAIFASAARQAFHQLHDLTSPHLVLSQITAALLLVGMVNAVNTGNINSDRSTWLFLSLVFVAEALRASDLYHLRVHVPAQIES